MLKTRSMKRFFFFFSVLCDNCIVRQLTSTVNFRDESDEKNWAQRTRGKASLSDVDEQLQTKWMSG